jgi:predicted cobalt transporter CbtA
MTEMPVEKHSKFAVAATILPLAVWVYLGLLTLLVISKPFVRFVNWIFRDDGLGALGVSLILAIFLFGVIPIAGHLAGIVCGIIGLFSKNKMRIFAVIGLILNITPFAIGLILYKSGYSFGSK